MPPGIVSCRGVIPGRRTLRSSSQPWRDAPPVLRRCRMDRIGAGRLAVRFRQCLQLSRSGRGCGAKSPSHWGEPEGKLPSACRWRALLIGAKLDDEPNNLTTKKRHSTTRSKPPLDHAFRDERVSFDTLMIETYFTSPMVIAVRTPASNSGTS